MNDCITSIDSDHLSIMAQLGIGAVETEEEPFTIH
jgi:hypothetical protein